MALWIAFEGPDRCGKTTQMKLAEEWLTAQGVPVILAKDPSPDVAMDIRLMLLAPEAKHPTTEFLLFLAARSELYHRIIEPQRENPGVILCDRYRLSTLAYQTSFPASVQNEMHKMTGLTDEPDAYFVFVPRGKISSEVENRWDDLSTEEYLQLGKRYVQAASEFQERSHIYSFDHENPQQVFEHFTRPSLEQLLTK